MSELASGGDQQVGDCLEEESDGLPPFGQRDKGSGEMLSFSVSTQNAEINDVNCWISIINQNSFAISLRKTTLIERCGKRHDFYKKILSLPLLSLKH